MSKPVIGIIGGIGAGKSRVAEELEKFGGRVIAADPLGHEALLQPAIRDVLVDRWGWEILGPDGQPNRRRVAMIVFSDAEERQALEGLTHPWIGDRIKERIAAAETDPSVRFIVLDAAVMLEANWDKACTKLVFVNVPRDERLRRLKARGWTDNDFKMREHAQLPVEEKATRADATIDNTGPQERLGPQITALLTHWGIA